MVRTWFKGADTVVVLKFMVHKYQMVLQNPDLLGENRSYLERILHCLEFSNSLMSALYRGGLFLTGRRLRRIVGHQQRMLDSYAACAALAMGRNLPRFKFNPKWHFLCHICLQLYRDYQDHGIALNPLSASCQMPEDFINKVATLSRSVQARRLAGSTIDKYQLCVAKAL